jgi:hypothetical protein
MRPDMAVMRALRHLLSLCLPALLAACGPLGASEVVRAEEPPPRVVEEMASGVAAPRGVGLLRQAMMDGHRGARVALGEVPLRWDEGLAASALTYARELARTGRFEHAQQPQGPTRQGENLWMGTRGAYRYDEMMGHWLAERRLFANLPVPQSSRTGQFGDVGHYSQIVWARSTAVGCAMASNRRDDFLVCRYSPTGNVFGERAF